MITRNILQAEVLSPRPLTHQTKHPLTHLNTLSLDIAEQPELVGNTEILSDDLVFILS